MAPSLVVVMAPACDTSPGHPVVLLPWCQVMTSPGDPIIALLWLLGSVITPWCSITIALPWAWHPVTALPRRLAPRPTAVLAQCLCPLAQLRCCHGTQVQRCHETAPISQEPAERPGLGGSQLPSPHHEQDRVSCFGTLRSHHHPPVPHSVSRTGKFQPPPPAPQKGPTAGHSHEETTTLASIVLYCSNPRLELRRTEFQAIYHSAMGQEHTLPAPSKQHSASS